MKRLHGGDVIYVPILGKTWLPSRSSFQFKKEIIMMLSNQAAPIVRLAGAHNISALQDGVAPQSICTTLCGIAQTACLAAGAPASVCALAYQGCMALC